MRDVLLSSLEKVIDKAVAKDLVDSYQDMIVLFRRGDVDGCLSTSAGRFVEHTLRALLNIADGKAPVEIKKVDQTVRQLENKTTLSESLRLVIPRILYGMIYEIRSKRGALHVKEVSPQYIDAALSVQAASWVMAEFVRLYHDCDEGVVLEMMASLSKTYMPLVEEFGDEAIVTHDVPCELELLIMIARSKPSGVDRKSLGKVCNLRPATTITSNLKRLARQRFVHKDKSGEYHITGPGEKQLSKLLADKGYLI